MSMAAWTRPNLATWDPRGDRQRLTNDGGALGDDAVVVGAGLTVRRPVSKGLLQSTGRHGADVKLGGCTRRRAAHGAGHACEASIAANVAFVHAMFADPTAVMARRPGCLFAWDVAARR
jgi:hypothetical protein